MAPNSTATPPTTRDVPCVADTFQHDTDPETIVAPTCFTLRHDIAWSDLVITLHSPLLESNYCTYCDMLWVTNLNLRYGLAWLAAG